ncbi:MAG: hypothetical protein QOG43_1581 [Actinomycetota bacterium]|nr:hypothetical protein [Actinomycetota bacterium]
MSLLDRGPRTSVDRWFPVRLFGAAWVAITLVTGAGIASLGDYRFHRISPHAMSAGVLSWLEGWTWWDGAWYVGIVRHGYFFRPGHMSSVAFFPGYPLAGRVLTAVLRDPLLALVVVSSLSGLAGVVLFHRWCGRHMTSTEARYAVASLVVYPCAFYLMGVTYADGMFLALALAAFVFLEDDRPVAAGVMALLATATRPLGVAVVAGLWWRTLELRNSSPSGRRRRAVGLRPADAGLLLAPMGLVAYCGYLAVRFGRPLAFVQAEAGWRQEPGPATWSKVSWFREMARSPYLNPGHLHLVGNALVAVVAVCLLPSVFRRFGTAYGVYASVLVVGAALSTRDFIGMGRYVLPAFPLFGVVGAAAARSPRVARAALVVSAGLLLGLAFVHGRGTLVS